MFRGTSGPVKTTVYQVGLIDQAKFVMHMISGSVFYHLEPFAREKLDIATGIVRLVIVGDDSHLNAPLVRAVK